MVKNILIISNKDRDPRFAYAVKTALCVSKLGANVFAEGDVYNTLCAHTEVCRFDFATVEEAPIDLCVVIGGDGTVLSTVKRLKGSNIPLLGINAGHLGYLTQIAKEDIETVLPQILAFELVTEDRFMLKATLYRDGEAITSVYALNEISLHRGGSRRIMQISVSVNGCAIDTFYADGMLVCTPTGSTAYNLSAGGPVAQPSAPVMIITPVCAHNLASPSVVTGVTDTICLCVQKMDLDGGPVLSADSGEEIPVQTGDSIVVKKSNQNVRLVKWGENDFYKVLQRKLYHR